MVWVNTDSGVYRKGGRWYGKTKTGKFMSEGGCQEPPALKHPKPTKEKL